MCVHAAATAVAATTVAVTAGTAAPSVIMPATPLVVAGQGQWWEWWQESNKNGGSGSGNISGCSSRV